MHVKRRSGFTLIELLVVVLIIGILAAIALPQYQKAVARARFAQVLTTLNALEKGMEMYFLNNRYSRAFKQGEELLSVLDVDIPDITCTGNTCISEPGGSWKVQWGIAGGSSSSINVGIWTTKLGAPSLVFTRTRNSGSYIGTTEPWKTASCFSPTCDSVGKMLVSQLSSQGWSCSCNSN